MRKFLKLVFKFSNFQILLFTIHYLLFTVQCNAQEQLGIASSLYAGINGISLNPSSSACSPFRFDVNIITFHTYFDNNDFYLYNASIPKIIANGSKPVDVANTYNIAHGMTSDIMFYDRNKTGNVKIFENLTIQGPSFMLSFENWSIGIITNMREGISAINVNSNLANVFYQTMNYKPLSHQYIYLPAFRINGTDWAEIGLNLSAILTKNDEMLIKGGFTLKELFGLSDMYIQNKSSYMYYANDKDMDFYYLNMNYGHALPASGAGIGIEGTGQSIDLGITFQRLLRYKLKTQRRYFYTASDCPVFCKTNPYLLYKWKLGISLIDMGYINFNRNAATYQYSNISTDWFNFAHWAPQKIQGFDNGISANFINQPVAQPVNNNFTTMLPGALCVQYDYYLDDEYYINLSDIQRIPHFNTPGIDRENIFAITPRWDDPYLGVSLPLILDEYMYPRIGLSFRFFNIFVIGTDRIGSFINSRFSGFDIYFSIKINKFNPCK